MTYQSTTEWRKSNPERNKELRQREYERDKSPEVRAKRNSQIRQRLSTNLESRTKRRQSRIKWLSKPGNKEKWYKDCRDRLHRKPWIRLLVKARVRCKESGLEYSLTNELAIERWTGYCELTGIAFAEVSGKATSKSPSLDRIDSKLGYTKDNCRFVLWGINRFKNDGTDEEMREIARALVMQ